MTTPPVELCLMVIAHDDAHLPVVWLDEGWGEAYRKQAAVVRLAKADLEKLGVKPGARVEVTGPAGSVVVAAMADAAGQAGVGLMPVSLYASRLSGGGPGVGLLPPRHIEARVAATAKDVTPVEDLMVRRGRA